MSKQTTIRKAAFSDPTKRRKCLELVEFSDDFRGTHYAIYHGVGTRGRYFEGGSAFGNASMAFIKRAESLGYITIANAAGPMAIPA